MKKMFMKYGGIVSALAMSLAMISQTKICFFCFHQPKIPNAVQKLRKI